MSGKTVDLELKKAFQELQAKVLDTTQKLKLADLQIDSLSKTIQHAQLTQQEIKSYPSDTNMYNGVGRMFLLTSSDDIVKMLTEKIDTSRTKIKDLETSKAYLERSMKDSEENLRELVASKKKDL
ncbi:prefoldin subunit 1 [Trichonephila inaurata madagascariensis]|uniref:Prefoldin subunit 1 n=1 Tax=Trichonephila inaurata madagascariensis TaxID=2747483 RepID=A0A8X6IHD8_9ARAC|nr:prefoldin subunit 1 [Trichonephila inaurata madagascariensis]GFY61865.1 prefoldin subunit 1 [Trichonephila inaurata madagascariensis]